jgi:hypothetical protein
MMVTSGASDAQVTAVRGPDRLGEVAAAELAAFDTDKDEPVGPIAREGVQVPPQRGDGQSGKDYTDRQRPPASQPRPRLRQSAIRGMYPPSYALKSGMRSLLSSCHSVTERGG